MALYSTELFNCFFDGEANQCAPYLIKANNAAFSQLSINDTNSLFILETSLDPYFDGKYYDFSDRGLHDATPYLIQNNVISNPLTFDYSQGFTNFKDTYNEVFSISIIGFLAICFFVALTIILKNIINKAKK